MRSIILKVWLVLSIGSLGLGFFYKDRPHEYPPVAQIIKKLSEVGAEEELLKMYNALLYVKPLPEYYMKIAKMHHKRGETEQEQAVLSHYLTHTTESVEKYLAIAEYYAGKKKYAKALLAYQAAKKISPKGNAMVDRYLGNAYLKVFDYENAKTHLQFAAQKGLEETDVYTGLGLLALVNLEISQAKSFYAKAKKLNKSEKKEHLNISLHNLAAGIAIHDGQLDQASQIMKKVYAVEQKDHDVNAMMGFVKYAQGQLKPAKSFLDKCWKLAKDPRVAERLASLAILEGDYESAASYLKSVKSELHSKFAIQQRLQALNDKKKDLGVKDKDTRLPAIKEYENGERNQNLNKVELAVANYKKALELDPSYMRPLHALIKIYLKKEDVEKSKEYLIELKKREPASKNFAVYRKAIAKLKPELVTEGILVDQESIKKKEEGLRLLEDYHQNGEFLKSAILIEQMRKNGYEEESLAKYERLNADDLANYNQDRGDRPINEKRYIMYRLASQSRDAAQRLNDFERASEIAKTLINLEPSYWKGYSLFAFAQTQMRNYRQAIDSYKKSIKLFSKQIESKVMILDTLNRAGKYYGTLSRGEKLRKEMPRNPDVVRYLSFAYRKIKRYKQALSMNKSFLEKNTEQLSNEQRAYVEKEIALIHALAGRYQQAIQYYQKSDETCIDCGRTSHAQEISRHYLDLGKTSEQLEWAQKAIQENPTAYAYELAANASYKLKLYGISLEFAQKSVEMDSRNEYSQNILRLHDCRDRQPAMANPLHKEFSKSKRRKSSRLMRHCPKYDPNRQESVGVDSDVMDEGN